MPGVHSLEHSAQEDTLLVLFNSCYIEPCKLLTYPVMFVVVLRVVLAYKFYFEITSRSAEILLAPFSPSNQAPPF
jgi:hypothetical protein